MGFDRLGATRQVQPYGHTGSSAKRGLRIPFELAKASVGVGEFNLDRRFWT